MKDRNVTHTSLLMLLLLLFCVTVFIAPATAEYTEVNSVTRTLPDNYPSNNDLSVVLEINAQEPFVIGIVETIPEGFTFPNDENGITSSCEFELDRNNRKIAFSVVNSSSITYKVIASSESGTYTFSGNWVDMLVQTTDLNEGAERWNEISGDKTLTKEPRTDTNSKSRKSSSSSSSGNSASLGSGEKYDNIAEKFVEQKYINSETKSEYVFDDDGNPINGISFMPLENGGTVSATIEVLQDVSSLAKSSPKGIVYKNINILIGNNWASEKTISDPTITFCVENKWLNDNNIDPSTIKLLRYTTTWNELPTTIVREDETQVYFSAETPGFSSFAISSIEKTVDTQRSETKHDLEDNSVKESAETPKENPETREEFPANTPGFGALLGCAMIAIGSVLISKIEKSR
ncbi:MAG: PGF-pre-PGF domain-containing protein [Methanococcoides sp.]|nr:PGF-pre-PGF domain-containing protein [Methanococcoides sp.]